MSVRGNRKHYRMMLRPVVAAVIVLSEGVDVISLECGYTHAVRVDQFAVFQRVAINDATST